MVIFINNISSKNIVSDADNYSVIFPLGATTEERALLLAAAFMLDFRYFEDSPN
jgi:hypothetical protein